MQDRPRHRKNALVKTWPRIQPAPRHARGVFTIDHAFAIAQRDNLPAGARR